MLIRMLTSRLLDPDAPTGASPSETPETTPTPPPAAPPAQPQAPTKPAQATSSTPVQPAAGADPTAALAERLAALETQHNAAQLALKTERTTLAIERAATAANVDAELVTALLSSKIEYDENGQPTGVAEAVAALVEKYPNLAKQTGNVGAPTSQASPTNPSRPPALTKAAIDRMTPDQINARWPEIEAFLARTS